MPAGGGLRCGAGAAGCAAARPVLGRPGACAIGRGGALLASSTHKGQKKLVGRLALSDDAVGGLVEALSTAADRRLSAMRVAAVLGVPTNRAPMVMSQVTKLLNVEGYPVVATDAATQAVTLDVALLAEQYGVRV